MLLTGRRTLLCLMMGLLIFGEGTVRQTDQPVPAAGRAEAGTEREVLDETDRADRMRKQYELLKEEEASAATALLELEAQLSGEDGEVRAEAEALLKELCEIRLKERVLEARILEAEKPAGKDSEEIFDK